MAIAQVLIAAGKLALKGLSRSKIAKDLGKKFKDFGDDVLQDAADKGAKAAKFSEKTGKPIKEFYKDMLPFQTGAKTVAKEGVKKGVKGTLYAVAPVAGYVAGEKVYDEVIESGNKKEKAKKKAAKERTIKENRRVVSETKLNKGGMAKGYNKGGYANCGASVSPNRTAKK